MISERGKSARPENDETQDAKEIDPAEATNEKLRSDGNSTSF